MAQCLCLVQGESGDDSTSEESRTAELYDALEERVLSLEGDYGMYMKHMWRQSNYDAEECVDALEDRVEKLEADASLRDLRASLDDVVKRMGSLEAANRSNENEEGAGGMRDARIADLEARSLPHHLFVHCFHQNCGTSVTILCDRRALACSY